MSSGILYSTLLWLTVLFPPHLVVAESWRDFQGWLDCGLFPYLRARSEILKQEKLVRRRWEMLDPTSPSDSLALVEVLVLSLHLSPSAQVILSIKWLATICTCLMWSPSEGSTGASATGATPLTSVTAPLALEKSHISHSTEQNRMPSSASCSGQTENPFSSSLQNWLK